MKKITRFLLPAVILGLGLAAMLVLLRLKSDTPPRKETVTPKIVKATEVTLSDVATEITAYGRVVSARPLELYADVSGELLPGDVEFLPAQSFRKGDVLVRIDDRQARLRVNSARSDLLSSLASALPEIRTDFADEWPIWQDFFSRCDFDHNTPELPPTSDERLKLLLARLNVYKLYFNVRDLEIILEKHKITAPFDGSILEVGLRVGATARVGSLLGSIISLERQEVRISLPASDLQWIDPQATVTLTSGETAQQWHGVITRVGTNVDTRTQTIDLYIAVNHDGSAPLLNSMFLNASIPGRVIENSMTLPRAAVYDERFVYKVTGGNLIRSSINVARWTEETAIVSGGLEDRDTVVIEALKGVVEGMPVSPQITRTEQGD